MTRIFLYAALALFAAVLALLLSVLVLGRKNRKLKDRLDRALCANRSLSEKVERLRKESAVKSSNRRESDEKVDALHDGDSVGNAIAGLSKRRNSGS